MRYALVIEKADGDYSGYAPDLPGCVATDDTSLRGERQSEGVFCRSNQPDSV